MLNLRTKQLQVFEIVLDAILIVDDPRKRNDANLLTRILYQLEEARQLDVDYLLPPYYMATIEDLLGRYEAAAQRLEGLIGYLRRMLQPGQMRRRQRNIITQLELEMRLNRETANYHLLRDTLFAGIDTELDDVLTALNGRYGRPYRRIRHRAQALRAQLFATRMIPSNPYDADRAQISEFHTKTQKLACRLAFGRWPFPFNWILSGTPPSTAVAAIARNALVRAEMYLTDYFCEPGAKIERLQWALDQLSGDRDRFRDDPENNYDRASCRMRLGYWNMRLGYWENSAADFDDAVGILTAALRQSWPGQGFALFTLGRVLRLSPSGSMPDAIQNIRRARDMPAGTRGISDVRVDRELVLADAGDTRYP
jgi:hypothetical protein